MKIFERNHRLTLFKCFPVFSSCVDNRRWKQFQSGDSQILLCKATKIRKFKHLSQVFNSLWSQRKSLKVKCMIFIRRPSDQVSFGARWCWAFSLLSVILTMVLWSLASILLPPSPRKKWKNWKGMTGRLMDWRTHGKSLALLFEVLNSHFVPSLTKGARVVHLRSLYFLCNNVLMRRGKKPHRSLLTLITYV